MAEDFDRCSEHAVKIFSLAHKLKSRGYGVAKHIDEAEVVPLDVEVMDEFERQGCLANGMFFVDRSGCIGWKLDAHAPKITGNPWLYEHCYVQLISSGRLSGSDFLQLERSWQHAEAALGAQVTLAGKRILRLAQNVHRSPNLYSDVAYIDHRARSSSSQTEVLAFVDEYWIDVFVTDSESKDTESLLTIAFTPRRADERFDSPSDEENLASPRLFRKLMSFTMKGNNGQ